MADPASATARNLDPFITPDLPGLPNCDQYLSDGSPTLLENDRCEECMDGKHADCTDVEDESCCCPPGPDRHYFAEVE